MSFSYNSGANPPIDYPRLLIADTVAPGIFSDQEIQAFTAICASTFQSGQFWSPPSGANVPAAPVSYYRIAALALDSLAANKARLASVAQILDVKLDPSKASQALRDQAQAYRDTEDNSGAFFIIEQVNDAASFNQRFWNQVQRQAAVG